MKIQEHGFKYQRFLYKIKVNTSNQVYQCIFPFFYKNVSPIIVRNQKIVILFVKDKTILLVKQSKR